jgi:hypothetical protein
VGFDFAEQSDGTVVIMRRGQVVTKLRGARAQEFLAEVSADPQQVMARWTGNYKRGNERQARLHPRNQGRR